MELPNADQAIVERRKVVDYLLNAVHPDNGGKAAFFEGLGFSVRKLEELMTALKACAGGKVITRVISSHGDKYVVDGPLTSATGKTGNVRTIWIVEPGNTAPRLVTAYPKE